MAGLIEKLREQRDQAQIDLSEVAPDALTREKVRARNLSGRDRRDFMEAAQAWISRNERDPAKRDLQRALRELRDSVTLTPMEQAGATLDGAKKNLGAFAMQQWNEVNDGSRPLGSRIAQGIGVIAGAVGLTYLAYKFVQWGERSSFFGKLIRGLGLAAVSAWALDTFGRAQTVQPAPTGLSAPPVAAAPNAPAASPVSSPKVFLDHFPDGVNLVGHPAISLDLAGRRHSILCTRNGIELNGKLCRFIAVGAGLFGSDVGLNLLEVARRGSRIRFRAGAFGKEGQTEGDENNVKDILQELLAGKTVEKTTQDNKRIRIQP